MSSAVCYYVEKIKLTKISKRLYDINNVTIHIFYNLHTINDTID